jgi:hypothetical protein
MLPKIDMSQQCRQLKGQVMWAKGVMAARVVLVITVLLTGRLSAQETASDTLLTPDPELPPAPQVELTPAPPSAPVPDTSTNIIRVPYFPEHMKQQIRDEIRNGLREDAVEAVLAQARQERWGLPDALPGLG